MDAGADVLAAAWDRVPTAAQRAALDAQRAALLFQRWGGQEDAGRAHFLPTSQVSNELSIQGGRKAGWLCLWPMLLFATTRIHLHVMYTYMNI